ncbi:alpha/beta hydrolase [Actinoplanes sp. NPDC051411]|uniref:alpha/beta fold hydrolase n=1 Tax=Actinoplanes sp. NPDC051411 TaxID=3155522 RepID=UPI00342847C7
MENLIVEGSGRSILVLHGGMGDLSSWEKVTDRLRERFRVARLYRPQYRLDVPRKVTMADEVVEVLAAAATLDRPVLVGHSSGAVLALEALVASPELFSAAALYEPPLLISDQRLGDGTQSESGSAQTDLAGGAEPGRAEPGGAQSDRAQSDSARPDGGGVSRAGGGRPVDRARAALADGRPGTAFVIFLREIAGLRDPMFDAAEAAINQRTEIAPVVERQLDDNDAIDALGNRLAAYSKIDLPVLLITGDQSPRHLQERLSALEAVLPDARRATLPGEGHNAERSAPERLAEVVGQFAAG